MTPGGRATLRIPGGVWALGFVSLLMDTSSEMIHGLLPIFIVSGLGASAALYGLIEGVAEAAVLVTKMASGAVSDYLRRRKVLAVLGYGLAAASKPLFPLAHSVTMAFVARLIDRIGKGIRGAPRDALIADITPAGVRGASYGLRQSLDSVGAVLGPLIALGLMAWSGGDIPWVFWWALLPGALSVGVLVAFVREPERPPAHDGPRWPIHREALGRLGGAFWRVVAVAMVLMLARFSEGFLVLRATDLGLGLVYAPLVLVVMNVSHALSSYPVGRLSDRIGRTGLVIVSVGLLALADAALALAGGIGGAALGVVLWGLHLGFSQGLLHALVADTVDAELRGTAFGVFSLCSGGALLTASAVAGLLWDAVGPSACFWTGAALATCAAVGLYAIERRARPAR
jgi:MFS family permease